MKKVCRIVGFLVLFVRVWGLDWEHLPFLQNVETLRLSNGLIVYLQRDTSTPLVFVSVVYKVGFRSEATNQRGYTHLLEHMMFKGSTNYPKGVLHQRYGEEGIRYNAYTAEDMTLYYAFGPVGSLETILSIEADRMQGLLMEKEEFKRERQVVADELCGYEANPSFQLQMAMLEKFVSGHPLSWGPGKATDLLQASYEDVMKLYRTYYVPNNAFLLVIGNVERKTLVDLLGKYFAAIPAHPSLPQDIPCPPSFSPGQVVSVSGPAEESFGRLLFGSSGFSYTHRDSLVGYFIVEAGLVRGIEATFTLDASFFSLDYERSPSFPGMQIEREYLQKELPRARHALYQRYRLQKNDLEERGMMLSSLLRYGDISQIQRWMALFDTVTVDEVSQFLQRVMVASHAISGYFTATQYDQNRRPTPVSFQTVENFGFSAVMKRVWNEKESQDLVRRHEKVYRDISTHQQNFFQGVKRYVLSNGIVILIKPLTNSPLVSLAWEFRDDAFREAKPYQETFLQWYISEGGPQYTLRKKLEERGAWGSAFSLNVDVSDWREALAYLAKMYMNRKISPLVLEEMKEKYLLRHSHEKEHPSPFSHIKRILSERLFEPYVFLDIGARKEDILGLHVMDIEKMYHAIFRPENMVIAVVGNVPEKEILSEVERLFLGWNPPSSPLKPYKTVFKKDRRQSVLEITWPGDQARVLIAGKWGVSYTNERQWVQGLLANHIFGGSGFSSWLMQDIRDKSGLTYSIESDLSLLSYTLGETLFLCEFTTFKHMVKDILDMYQKKLLDFQNNGPHECELLQHKMEKYAEEVFALRSPEDMASRLAYNEAYRGRYDYTLRYLQYLYDTTAEDVKRVSREAFPQGDEIIIIAK
ncbi:MAG: insulinase family protein [Brevinematales bacterium]|nr:insulinase family protein [Brevinematales bacterium]